MHNVNIMQEMQHIKDIYHALCDNACTLKKKKQRVLLNKTAIHSVRKTLSKCGRILCSALTNVKKKNVVATWCVWHTDLKKVTDLNENKD